MPKFHVTFEIEAATEDEVVKWAAESAKEIGDGRWNVKFERDDGETADESDRRD